MPCFCITFMIIHVYRILQFIYSFQVSMKDWYLNFFQLMIKLRNMKKLSIVLIFIISFFCTFSCKTKENSSSREKLFQILETENLSTEEKFSVINQISQSMLNSNETNNLILFLTDYISSNPNDYYNAYWLLIIAFLPQNAIPIFIMLFVPEARSSVSYFLSLI